jgi:Spy/CpxP family protein refolding chaperone
MRISRFVCVLALLLPIAALGQGPGAPPPPAGGHHMMNEDGAHRGMDRRGPHHEMGEWWRNSEIAKKLQLSDDQISKLNQIFFDHRMKLIDNGAAMQKEDLKLQTLLDTDDPNENQVSAQVDQVLAARGKLEHEFTMMNFHLRKVLSVEQWKQLKSIREERGPNRNDFFYKRMPPGAGPHDPPLPPGPAGDLEPAAPPDGNETF